MLEIASLSHTLHGRVVLADVSFTLEEGGALSLLGPSGGGKTTLLRQIMGFDAPTSGRIAWRGRTLSEGGATLVPTEARRFGMVFQDAALFPHLDVAGNIAFGLSRLAREERRKRVEEWLERLGLTALRRRRVQALSGGERQRVALARALAAGPELLLLDEPFSNLDRLVRNDLLARIKEVLRDTRTTSILVTHDVRDAVDLGGDCLLLAQGEIRHRGGIQAGLEHPEDGWVRRFLASGLGLEVPDEETS